MIPLTGRLHHRCRGQGGFTLVDLIVAAAVTALLSGAIFGGVAVVLKVSPASSSSVVSGQFTRNLQNIELVATEGVLREDWRQGSIVKVNPDDQSADPYFNNSTGLECNGGTSSAYYTPGRDPLYSNVGPVVSLQRPAALGEDVGFPAAGNLAKGRGLIRAVYVLKGRVQNGAPVLRPDGSRVRDLVRRECAAVSGQIPVKTSSEGGCGLEGEVNTDCRGWRYQPGSVSSTFTYGATWTPVERELLRDVRDLTSTAPCNPTVKQIGDSDYVRCDVTLTVTFGNNRTHQIRLYQGLGF